MAGGRTASHAGDTMRSSAGVQGAKPRPVRNQLEPGETKECRRCHPVLGVTDFYPSQLNSDGRRSYCKTCDGEARREWARAPPERRNEIQRAYWARKTAEGKVRHDQQ